MYDFSGRGERSFFFFPGAADPGNYLKRGSPNNLSFPLGYSLAFWGAEGGQWALFIFFESPSFANGKISFPPLPDRDFNSSVQRFCHLVFGIYERF